MCSIENYVSVFFLVFCSSERAGGGMMSDTRNTELSDDTDSIVHTFHSSLSVSHYAPRSEGGGLSPTLQASSDLKIANVLLMCC